MKLAKWEDRGFYAQQQATDKAQRQLQQLITKAEIVLTQPAASVLSQTAKAMGLDDLQLERPDSPAEPQKVRSRGPVNQAPVEAEVRTALTHVFGQRSA